MTFLLGTMLSQSYSLIFLYIDEAYHKPKYLRKRRKRKIKQFTPRRAPVVGDKRRGQLQANGGVSHVIQAADDTSGHAERSGSGSIPVINRSYVYLYYVYYCINVVL